MPKQRIRTFTVTIAEDVKRDHAAGLLRILSRGDIPGYIEECRRECAVTTNENTEKEVNHHQNQEI